jgi:hypothetical protein
MIQKYIMLQDAVHQIGVLPLPALSADFQLFNRKYISLENTY